MGADAALIQAFSRLADADKRDYSRQLRLQKEGGDILTEGITEVGGDIAKILQDRADAEDLAYKQQNEQIRLENQKFDKEFNKQTEASANALTKEGAGLQEDAADAFRGEIRDIGDRFSSYNVKGEGPQSIEDKDNQTKEFNNIGIVEKEIVKARTLFGIAIKPSPSMSKEAKERYLMCLNSDDYDNVTTSFVDGKLQYEITTPAYIDPISQQEITPTSTKTYTLDDLEEDFTPEATNTETFILGSGADFKDRGKKERYGEVTQYMLQGEADKIADELEKDPKILADIAQRRLGARPKSKSKNDSGMWNVGSVAYGLQDHPSLDMAIYQAAGVEVDTDGDGEVSQAEAKVVWNSENRDKVIETIVNPKAEGFNLAKSCEIVAMHIALEHAQFYRNGQNAAFDKDKGNKSGSGGSGGYDEITGDS